MYTYMYYDERSVRSLALVISIYLSRDISICMYLYSYICIYLSIYLSIYL